jgi:hypothetical protein
MPDIFSLVSLSAIVNDALAGLLLIVAGWSLRFIGPRAWRSLLLGNKARKRLGFIEIWKRIKSDTYYQTCQTEEITMGACAFWFGIMAFVLGSTAEFQASDKPETIYHFVDAAVVTLLLCLAIFFWSMWVWELTCNRKAG